MLTKERLTLQDILGDPISRDEAYDIICSSPIALQLFNGLSIERQDDILDFIQGNKGLPILYDGFFKYVLDPERHPERLESLLSDVLGQKITIEQVLLKEGNQLNEEGSLVVMDILVRLSDGSVVDVEMQKYGYFFTGERSSCYISDMIMRQYHRLKNAQKEHFRFSQMKPVYLIVLMENSTKEFKAVEPTYIHRMHCDMDSGVKINLLPNLVYVSLDTFHKVGQNIDSNLKAWLTFLSSDKPEDIIRLVEKYPEFRECYRDIIMFRRKPEELMCMFSEALRQIDRNTERYMIEEQRKELEANQKELEEQKRKLEAQNAEIEAKDAEIEAKDAEIAALKAQLAATKK